MIAMRDRGFTLIELLVALFIAAIMFAIGYGAINQALQSRGNIRRDQQDLLQLQAAMNIMEQDFVQLAPRPVRSPDGNGWLACLQGNPVSQSSGDSDDSDRSNDSGSSDDSDSSDNTDASDISGGPAPLVILTRGGWSNPTGLERTELERVAYVLDNGTLVREHWNVLDATLSSMPVKRNLLKGLRSVSFRYMQPSSHSWLGVWPPSGAPIGGNPGTSYYQLRPMAVEVTLDTRKWGKITRIFEIAQ